MQSFPDIIEKGYTYIDKTRLVHKLVNNGKYYFLSRPRRFGKSLLLSTLKAYYESRKDLFKCLDIYPLVKEWPENPVFLMSLATYNPVSNNLNDILDFQIASFEKRYVVPSHGDNIAVKVANAIRSAYDNTGKKVVILVDEYDAPLVAHLGDENAQEGNRSLLKSIYTNFKDLDEYIEFVMLTGVSRFSKLTIFSGLNNLNDISLDPVYSEICGITERELEENFVEGIDELSRKMNINYNLALTVLKENYDGYHFTEDSVDIYNPFSLLNALSKSKIGSYWFQSGTPTFLVEVLQDEKEPLAKLLNETVGEVSISDIDTYRTNPVSLLFQTGYLTIKDYDQRRRRYKLGIPNKEVASGLFLELLASNAEMYKDRVSNRIWDIRDAFDDGDPDTALDIIKSFLAGIPANVTQNKREIFYENNLFLIFKLIGIDARAEFWTSDGRIDMLLDMPGYVYVMELKLDQTPEKALDQINSKQYALQWKHDNRKVFKIGLNFSTVTRTIDSWIIED